MEAQDSKTVQWIMDGLAAAMDCRTNFDSHWEDVARVVLPHFRDSFTNQIVPTQGRELNQYVFDTTANTALFRYAAAEESMLTPRNGRWHGIRIIDPNLNKLRQVRLWCEQVTDLLFHYRYSPRANYQSQQHDGYVSQGAFGTSCLFVDKLADSFDPTAKGLRYVNVPLGQLYVAQNHQGLVDKVWRRFPMTLRNVATAFGEDALSPEMRTKLADKPEFQVWCIHHVTPREAWSPMPLSGKSMRYASYYLLEEDRTVLDEGGYRTFPYCVARYTTGPGEIYGRGPAMLVLPSIKGLNAQKKTMLKQAHRTVDPVLLAHDDGVLDGLNLTPGAVNFGGMSAEGRRLVDVLPTGNLSIGVETMQDDRTAINDAFFVTLFQILVDQPTMTATEVLERAREKGALLSPTFGRFQTESLGPQILREYELLFSQGLIPLPPPELLEANATWAVEYDAPLNRAMKAESGAGFQRTVQFAAEIATQAQDPSVLDAFDFDVALRGVAELSSVPESWMAAPEVIAAKRAGRQQAQQTQQAIDAGPAMAAMAKATAPQGQQVGNG